VISLRTSRPGYSLKDEPIAVDQQAAAQMGIERSVWGLCERCRFGRLRGRRLRRSSVDSPVQGYQQAIRYRSSLTTSGRTAYAQNKTLIVWR